MNIRTSWVVVGLVLAIAFPGARSARTQQAPVETVEFFAESVDRLMKYAITMPPGYNDPENADIRYPTLYLLHGFGSNYRSWSRFLGVPYYALDLQMIVVMVDAGNSFYVNWASTSDDRSDQWEDYIVQDVIGHVEASYRASPRREGRAIGGFSMGGYGALVIGLRHPELFGSVGSLSGALDYARRGAERIRAGAAPRTERRYSSAVQARRDLDNPEIGVAGFSSLDDRTPKGQTFTTVEQADAHDPFKLVLQVPLDELPHIHLDCGIDDRLIDNSQEFASLLLQHDIPFDYMQLAGGHDPEYWIQAVGYLMGVQHERMQRAMGRRPVVVRRNGRVGAR